MYSKGLRDAVARLLVVEPQRRASVQEILSMEAVAANRNQIPQAPPAAGEAIVSGVDIVRTIQVPHRFNDLTKALPPSRYDKPLGNPNPYPNPNPNSNPNPNPNPNPTPTLTLTRCADYGELRASMAAGLARPASAPSGSAAGGSAAASVPVRRAAKSPSRRP